MSKPTKATNNDGTTDKRPDPKPRKHPQLWQAYLIWDEMVQLRKRHTLRLDTIEKGKSNMDADVEREFIGGFLVQTPDGKRLKVGLHGLIDLKKREMVAWGAQVGPVWGWVTAIRGLKEGGLAAQLLAQIDDIAKFSNISKLWRFAGHGEFEYWITPDGAIAAPREGKIPVTSDLKPILPGVKGAVTSIAQENDRCVSFVVEPREDWHLEWRRDIKMAGFVAPYNAILKSVVWQIVDQFIRQQTPGYVDLYYQEKTRLRTLHPEPVKANGRSQYTDGHLHAMAIRKTGKVFLQHLWLTWRESEGLPVTLPYVISVLNHSDYVAPFAELAAA